MFSQNKILCKKEPNCLKKCNDEIDQIDLSDHMVDATFLSKNYYLLNNLFNNSKYKLNKQNYQEHNINFEKIYDDIINGRINKTKNPFLFNALFGENNDSVEINNTIYDKNSRDLIISSIETLYNSFIIFDKNRESYNKCLNKEIYQKNDVGLLNGKPVYNLFSHGGKKVKTKNAKTPQNKKQKMQKHRKTKNKKCKNKKTRKI